MGCDANKDCGRVVVEVVIVVAKWKCNTESGKRRKYRGQPKGEGGGGARNKFSDG